MSELSPTSKLPQNLVAELREPIAEAGRHAAAAVNIALPLLYWRVGDRIRRKVLGNERAGYGEEIYVTLSRELNWSHFKELLPLTRPLEREFHAKTSRVEGWSVRNLRGRASNKQIELLELDPARIHVAEYLTELPSREVFERKLHDAIAAARLRFENKEPDGGAS